MRKFSFLFVSLSFLLFFFSCGKKGPLLPPLVQIPKSIEGFRAVQQGSKVILTWLNPTTYIDGRPLEEVKEVEIWMLEEEKGSPAAALPINKEDFGKQATFFSSVMKDHFPDVQKKGTALSREIRFVYPLPSQGFLSKKFTFGLKVQGKKGKESGFSELAVVEPKPLPLPPQKIAAAVFEDRIEVGWEKPEKNIDQSTPPNLKGYNIFRSEEDGEVVRLNSTVWTETLFADKAFEFRKHYRYFIRAAATESEPFLESEDSETKEILARDEFAPSPPEGLVAIPGAGLNALSWNPAKEKDLDGYKIWRKAEGEDDFVLLTSVPIHENTYTDTSVEKSKLYGYAVTALDKSGNESDKSAIVFERAR